MKKLALRGLALLAFLVAATSANAITYNINQSFGGGGVTGTIDTDGTIGTILGANITNWSLTLTDTSGSFLLNGLANSQVLVSGTAFTSTATQLLFNFSAGSGFVLFQNPFIGSSKNFWCIDNGGCINSFVPGQTVRIISGGTQVGANFSGNVTIGNVSAVPLPAAFPLLCAGLAGLGGLSLRRKKRKT